MGRACPARPHAPAAAHPRADKQHKEMKRTWLITGIGIVLGALAGWAYWYQWGCTEGCTITGSPINSTLYGGLMGALLVNSFKSEEKETEKQPNNKS